MPRSHYTQQRHITEHILQTFQIKRNTHTRPRINRPHVSGVRSRAATTRESLHRVHARIAANFIRNSRCAHTYTLSLSLFLCSRAIKFPHLRACTLREYISLEGNNSVRRSLYFSPPKRGIARARESRIYICRRSSLASLFLERRIRNSDANARHVIVASRMRNRKLARARKHAHGEGSAMQRARFMYKGRRDKMGAARASFVLNRIGLGYIRCRGALPEWMSNFSLPFVLEME